MQFNLRALAAKALWEVVSGGQSLSAILPAYKRQCEERKDAAFLQSLVFGALRHYPLLEVLAKQSLKHPLADKDEIVFYILCIGFYQLKFMRVPAHAALSETVEAARMLQKQHLSGLVNGVLRNYLRNQDRLDRKAIEGEPAQYLHPAWLIRRIREVWPSDWQAILAANNAQPPLTLRVNTRLISVADYLAALSSAGIQAEVVENDTVHAIVVEASDVKQLPGFKEGWFYAQDVSAQMAVPLLSLAPEQRVLDVCAAPGGKTTQLWEVEPKLAEVVAVDVAGDRCERIKENAKRLQVPITVIIADACQTKRWWDKRLFDRILVDAPCSATGVIRRHPDIKVLRRERDVTELVRHQLNILESVWPLLKPAGILVYTTCAILPEENEGVIETFLKTHPDAKVMPISMTLGKPQRHGHQILSGQADQDGFYYARLQKQS